MATSSFTRKIIVTGKEATDILIEALTSENLKEKSYEAEKLLTDNDKRGRESLEKFASLCKK